MKILIAGDSFAAKWPRKDTNIGWVEKLAEQFDVVNVAQAGVGEYKIYKQLTNIELEKFDLVIVSHTSPSRVHTRNHPLHKEGLHKDCDLIVTDLIGHFQPFNNNLQISKSWFKYHYDEEYQIDIYELLREKIKSIINIPYISMTHVSISAVLSTEFNNIDFSKLWAAERGDVNHYNKKGNDTIVETILQILEGAKNG
jgi:hypothetical protein